MKQQKNYDKSIAIIKSLINVAIELCETILINGNYNINNNIFKSIKPKINGLDNNSLFDNSLDIYECNNTYSTQDIINFNKEEEKKSNLLKQIKEIIIEKINYITKELNLILDSSFIEKIEHIHSWNFQQIKPFPTFSFLLSNIKRSNTNNNNSINNISINDDFDFSVSKSFYNHSQEGSISPKFNNNSFNSNNNKNIENKIKNKMPINISNESKSLICSFNEISNNKKKENNKKDIVIVNDPKKIINILEYSMVDLNEGENFNKNIVNEKNNNKNNDIIEDKKNENNDLNSLSFNNEIINEKKNNDNINEEAELLIDNGHNKNNSSFIEYKSENNINNFTLKNI